MNVNVNRMDPVTSAELKQYQIEEAPTSQQAPDSEQAESQRALESMLGHAIDFVDVVRTIQRTVVNPIYVTAELRPNDFFLYSLEQLHETKLRVSDISTLYASVYSNPSPPRPYKQWYLPVPSVLAFRQSTPVDLAIFDAMRTVAHTPWFNYDYYTHFPFPSWFSARFKAELENQLLFDLQQLKFYQGKPVMDLYRDKTIDQWKDLQNHLEKLIHWIEYGQNNEYYEYLLDLQTINAKLRNVEQSKYLLRLIFFVNTATENPMMRQLCAMKYRELSFYANLARNTALATLSDEERAVINLAMTYHIQDDAAIAEQQARRRELEAKQAQQPQQSEEEKKAFLRQRAEEDEAKQAALRRDPNQPFCAQSFDALQSESVFIDYNNPIPARDPELETEEEYQESLIANYGPLISIIFNAAKPLERTCYYKKQLEKINEDIPDYTLARDTYVYLWEDVETQEDINTRQRFEVPVVNRETDRLYKLPSGQWVTQNSWNMIVNAQDHTTFLAIQLRENPYLPRGRPVRVGTINHFVSSIWNRTDIPVYELQYE